MNYIYELDMKVRDYECDLQGIVNNANYQHYLEHTRHEFLTSVGVSFAALHEQGVDPVVARISMAFKTPLKSGDEFVSKLYMKKEGIKYFSNIGVSEFLVEAAEVSVGDKLLITGPTTGALFMTLEEARVDLESVQTVKKGQHFSMKSDKIRPSDKLYKLVSTEELKKFKGLDVEQKRG